MNVKGLFFSELTAEISKFPARNEGTFTRENTSHLPEPVRKYLKHCGYIGKPRDLRTFIVWEDTYLRLSPKKPWNKIQCYQFNSVTEPCRIVYMKSKMMGLVPFEGRDTFRDGAGNMYIVLAKFFTVQDAKGPEMDSSALVTVLSESLLLPAYALQKYIKWTSLDSRNAKAEIEYNGIKAAGIFRFNDDGEFIRFETEDRYQSQKDGSNIKMKWFVTADKYTDMNGVKFPAYLTANWVTPDGNYQYFKGTIKTVEQDIKRVKM